MSRTTTTFTHIPKEYAMPDTDVNVNAEIHRLEHDLTILEADMASQGIKIDRAAETLANHTERLADIKDATVEQVIAAHEAGVITDEVLEELLQAAGEQGYEVPQTNKARFGFFLRGRRATRQVADGARNAAVRGKGSLNAFWTSVNHNVAEYGVRGVLKGLSSGMRRVISEWIGWANVANLLVATKSGRTVLRAIAKPMGWVARKVNPLLRKNTTVGEKMDQAKAKAADKFERVDKAFNVRKNMDLSSNMMFRYRLSAVIGIARKAAPKVFAKGTKACKSSVWLAVAVFLATDKTAHRYAKSLWTKVRSLKIDVALHTQPTVMYGPEAPAENVAYQANRRDRRAAAKAAAKAAGRKVIPTDEPAASAA